jgi:hypothetical protein
MHKGRELGDAVSPCFRLLVAINYAVSWITRMRLCCADDRFVDDHLLLVRQRLDGYCRDSPAGWFSIDY